jgi:hypothetical protein
MHFERSTTMRTFMGFATAVILILTATHPIWAQTTPSVIGTVQQYLLNPHGEVDGLLLSDGTVVRFPPHMGIALVSSVKAGDAVTVVGFLGPTTPQGVAIKALTITTNSKTGHTLVDQPPVTRPLPPDLRGLTRTALTVSGTLSRFLANPHGEIDGLILSGGEQVKFPPHQGAFIVMALGRAGGAITVTGFGTKNAFGTVVEGQSMTMGDQTVWTR